MRHYFRAITLGYTACAVFSLLFIANASFGEGSKNLAPDSTGVATGVNQINAYLIHSQGNGTVGITGDFMDPSASADERLYVHVKQGEVLYMGFRRTDETFSGSATFGDLNVIVRQNDGTFVTSFLILADQTSDNGAGELNFAFQTPQAGVITSYARALAGPSTIAGASGYNAISFTNSSLPDQDFYIEVIQSTAGSGVVTDPADINAIDVESRYDLWDFSVYNGTTEKPGRIFTKRWGFTTSSFANDFSQEMQLFVKIPSTVGGLNAGNYIKEINLAGLEPFTTAVFANATGADIGSVTDLNGDGVSDFLDARRSQPFNIGGLEYDIFINNPDIDIYQTTTLPTVSISNANFYCNSAGTGGEASINIVANQSGTVAMFLNFNGEPGYQDGTTDVIIEAEIDASSGSGSTTVRWDGLDGTGAAVPSGTEIEITGRFTAGALHLPLWDPEQNLVGINMIDIRPQTSFNLIYWDDTEEAANLDSSPTVELTGTNTGQHTWTDDAGDTGGDGILVNTWSYGFFQSNTQNVIYVFDCDEDGDGLVNAADGDGDNDGLSDALEGDYKADADADGIPDYLDSDFAGFVDANGDGVNDNFDQDMDGIPNALDLDSDNDGIPDVIEIGLVDTNNDGQIDVLVDLNQNGVLDTFDTDCPTNAPGDGQAQRGTGTNGANTLGSNDGTFGQITQNQFFSIDLGITVPAGETITLRLNDAVGAVNATANVFQSPDDVNFSNGQLYTATTGAGAGTGPETFNYVLTIDARYIAVQEASGGNTPVNVHSVTYTYQGCLNTGLTIPDTDDDAVANYLDLDSDNDGIVDAIEAGGTAGTDGKIRGFVDANLNGRDDNLEAIALTIPDSDSDGSFADYIDIDSDNDGILDNIEAQISNAIIASTAGDTDSNGLLDVYDPNNGGTLITPVNTDGADGADYIDTDADDDGVPDFIEGRDSDTDGFSDLDANENGDLSDETGHNVDADSDGLWDIFEGVTAPVQNTDNADLADYQDTDDDNDGSLTSGEDINGNGNFTDDKTQGQGAGSDIPDYLYRGDYDGDAIADGLDADSDNDGITDATESNGESIDPSGDEDADGIPNYRDLSDATVTAGLSATTDANGDGVYDVYDTDGDGIPDFLDLDSDNDGIWDAIEADGGSIPNGLNTSTGQFNLDDPDNDGLMNYVDTDDVNFGGISDLENPNTDGDALSDYRDIDSDGDGIQDIIESQSSSNLLVLSGIDSDGDGIDDTFDPTTGGVLIDPINSDGLDLRDYIDLDSDNDMVPDIIEGNDGDNDGIADHGTTSGSDTDGDGLDDTFDTDNGGTEPIIQNTDGIDQRDWRDNNDDNDGIITENEDANGNNDYSDDQTQGQSGSIPDYLFISDFDGDGIADINDNDSDNDGIPDTAEESGGQSIDPSGDEDGDGIPNFRDLDDPAVTSALTSTADTNGDGVYDVYDKDLDGTPDFRDGDSDNDGIPDLVEVGGIDTDGDGKIDGLNDSDNDGIPDAVDVDFTGGGDIDDDGIDDAFDASETGGADADGDDIIDSADPDRDGDGTPNTYDTDPDNAAVFTSTLIVLDTDGDGIGDAYDIDSDGDGIPDIVEAGGVDTNGDGKVDNLTDTDNDGFADVSDSDNGGTAYVIPDSDSDGISDFRDLDSDNDGITDTEENAGEDSNSDGKTDGFAIDTDGDGLADDVDPDNGGTPIANVDTDNDGISDYRDLDADNDGYPDILEGGGVDTDGDGVVDATRNSDPLEDSVPDNVDVDNFSANGGTGIDSDGDEIDNAFDVDATGGIDTDGDGIDDTFDTDIDGNGYDDATEATPYGQSDRDHDGNNDYRDLDADGDGIPDVIELGLTVDVATGRISGFTDVNNNGWDDTQEIAVITPPDKDSDSLPDFQDIDSDNDGLPDLIEAQTLATFSPISGIDSDADGLDDAFDPDNGGTLVAAPNTDGAGDPDYLDTDSDGDGVPDNIEGANDDRNQFADWDTDNDNQIDDEVGYDIDTDQDGLWDIFDNDSGITASNVTGSSSNGQDSDQDGIWDFQDTDDDGDGLLTSSQGAGNEDTDSNGNPTDDFDDDVNSIIPNYLFGNNDGDGDGIANTADFDSDNDGLADTREDGGTGIDPSGDIDGDGLLNAQDFDMDGDGIRNENDTDADASGTTDAVRLTDDNGDGIPDQLDKDQDGIPDFLDLDSDNDGIADIIELGLTDADEDGTLNEGAGIADFNGNGIDDSIDAACVGTISGNAASQTNNGATNPDNALGVPDDTYATISLFANNETMTLTLDNVIPSGTAITISARNFDEGGNGSSFSVTQSTDGAIFSNTQNYTTTVETVAGEDFTYTTTIADVQVIRITQTDADDDMGLDGVAYTIPGCPAATEVVIPDTDADGVDNHLDLDSDNDGISDNRESQNSVSYVAPAAGDADGDGILDVYDEDFAVGNAIDPVNSEGTGNDDYLDTDSDDDGVLDRIEGFDSDMDGFADWDTNGNNDPSDEVGFTLDPDKDGILLLFDNESIVSLLNNINGTSSSLQDSDSNGIEDWRDDDDDGDGIDTFTEDDNSNGNYADDFTQGGGSTPDYLYNQDYDGDNIADNVDYDSDNDGILNADEVSIDLPNPFGDSDRDDIYNYIDSDNAGFVDVNGDGIDDRYDQDRDGIADFFDLDSDNDGITDILEAGLVDANGDGLVDSFTDGNSDGAADAISLTNGTLSDSNGAASAANSNAAPDGADADINAAGEYITLNLGSSLPVGTAVAVVLRKPNGADGSIELQIGQSTVSGGPFTNNQVFSPANSSTFKTFFITLDAVAQFVRIEINSRSGGRIEIDGIYFNADSPEDFDNDGLVDFKDLDSDNDGVVDNVEARLTTDYVAPSGVDSDGDGIDNSYDVDNGATALILTNTDGDTEPDYRDADSDNNPLTPLDGVLDIVEGFDANRNGFSELDSDLDGDLSDETGYNVDTDGDGLWDLFDTFSGRGTANITGSKADLQDTDNDGFPDYRDTDDDGDGLNTASEDLNTNGIFTDDKVQGGGATPDYLFFNDTDNDGVADGQDADADNDGIPNSDEYNNVLVTIDPFGDEDGDGIFNYTDNSDPALVSLTDSDNDGIYDEYDKDLDGVPNFFDLDSDNDGIPDATEANGGVLPFGATDNGQFPGTDPDNDNDGLVDAVDTAPSNPALFATSLTLDDTDGDGVLPDFLDLDSDNDGIADLIEAGGNDFNGDGKIDGFGDTDGDGLANLVDSDNGGTALPVTSSDADGLPDYRDLDSEGDGVSDWNEGFDDSGDGAYVDDYNSRRAIYETNNGGNPGVYTTTDGNGNMIPDFLDDDDSDGRPNFLSPGHPTYVDTDGDGIVDFFDPDNGGTIYAAPDRDSDGLSNVVDGVDVPLPLDFLGLSGIFVDGIVELTWLTANEIDNDRFEIERSLDGTTFEIIGNEKPLNNINQTNTYQFTDYKPQFGTNYYRIRQVDIDGASTTTEIIVVFAETAEAKFTLFPNPATDVLNVKTNFSSPVMDVEIISLSGKKMHVQRYDQDASVNEIKIDVSQFPAGVYYVGLRTEGATYQFKLLKQ